MSVASCKAVLAGLCCSHGRACCSSTTGAGLSDCASCASPLTAEGECATCNAGAELSGGACLETPTAPITVTAAEADAVGMGEGAAFLSDEGSSEKGSGWAIFSAEVALTGMYEARLLVPSAADAPGCDSRATAAPVVVHHSGTARRTVSAADLSPPGPGERNRLRTTFARWAACSHMVVLCRSVPRQLLL